MGKLGEQLTTLFFPADMVINVAHALLSVVPQSNVLFGTPGSQQVELIIQEDKRQVGMVIGCSLSGNLIPPQLIYAGKTPTCQPSYSFPLDWSITHSPKPNSDVKTLEQYIVEVLNPHLKSIRDSRGYSEMHPALLIVDSFWAMSAACVVQILNVCVKFHIRVVFLPPACEEVLQPVDLSCKEEIKAVLKEHFMHWYAAEIQHSNCVSGQLPVDVDLRLSVMKPIHADWIVQTWLQMQHKRDQIIRGWEESGIKSAFDDAGFGF
jgi:hypothetical protein